MSFIFPTISKDNTPPISSGHVSVHWNGFIIVWGGYHDSARGDRYHPSLDLWAFCIESCTWKQYKTTGSIPPPLSGACASCIGCHMYLFAGHGDMRHTSNVYILNLWTFEWQHITDRIKGERPSGRDKLCCWSHKEFLVYFGGYGAPPAHTSTSHIKSGKFISNGIDVFGDDRGWNSHLFVLDTIKLTWSQPDACKDQDKRPCPRAAHAAAKLGNRGYLFGGRFLQTRRNDLYYLDLDTWEWSGSVQTTGSVPEGRTWHSLSAVSARHLFLYGGFNNNEDVLGDTYILDTEYMMWSRLALPMISASTKRMWHTACTTSSEGEVIIFGGSETCVLGPSLPEHCNSVLIFRFTAKSLLSLCADAVVKNLDQLQGELRKLPLHVLHHLIKPARLDGASRLQKEIPGIQMTKQS